MRRADDRLASYVERGIDDHPATREFFEALDHAVVVRVVVGVHRLDPRAVVHVGNRRDVRARHVDDLDHVLAAAAQLLAVHRYLAVLPNRRHQQHVRTLRLQVDVLGDVLGQARGGEGSE